MVNIIEWVRDERSQQQQERPSIHPSICQRKKEREKKKETTNENDQVQDTNNKSLFCRTIRTQARILLLSAAADRHFLFWFPT